jgi:hypothetical protein
MNEPQFGKKVRLLLDQARGVDASVAAGLSAARERALARQRPEPAPIVALADHVLERFEGWGGLSLRILLPVALLVGGLAGIYGWEQNQRIAEIEDIDAQLLTDELPIDAYLDRGFHRWLKKREAEQ